MIHARLDYQRIQDPDGKIPADEPVFLVRAQDVAAADTVRAWAKINREKGGSETLSIAAEDHAKKMDAWPVKKPADYPKTEIQPAEPITGPMGPADTNETQSASSGDTGSEPASD